MRIGEKVEFQTGWGSYGVGVILDINERDELVTVRDLDDQSKWTGPTDLITTLEN